MCVTNGITIAEKLLRISGTIVVTQAVWEILQKLTDGTKRNATPIRDFTENETRTRHRSGYYVIVGVFGN